MKKTLNQMYDIPYIKEEAKTILKGEIGYAFCLSQAEKIQNAVGKPTEIYFGYYNKKGEPVLKEEQTRTPAYYAIKLLDEEIELIAYKKERLSWFKDNLELEVPIPLKKKLLVQSSITGVNRVWNEIYDLLTD